MAEDTPELEPALTATKAKYLNAINDLSRVVLPSFVEQEYEIPNCMTSEIEALADELGIIPEWYQGLCMLEIDMGKYTLLITGRAFHG